jgi:hypothetical protein
MFFCFLFRILISFGTRESIRRKGRSWRTNYPLVLAACHKFGQGDCVRSLHELNKSVSVGEGQGRTKAFPNFLCIWTNKEQVFFILYFLIIARGMG